MNKDMMDIITNTLGQTGLLGLPYPHMDGTNTLTEYETIQIGGIPVYTETSFEDSFIFDQYSEAELKYQMIEKIIKKVCENNSLVEFTKSRDPNTGRHIIRARMYLLPNNEIKTLRVRKLIK